jgi:NAD(P)H-flavin reductase
MPAVIAAIRDEVPHVHTYHLRLIEPEDVARYRIAPGQFNMLYVPGVGESAISVSGELSHGPSLVHTIRSVGNVTGALLRSRVGTTIGLRGPFGTSWPVESCWGKDVVLIAGGIGLAPLRPVIYDIITHRRRFGSVWVLMGARSPADLLYAEEFDDWTQHGITVDVTVDSAGADWVGNVGVVTPLINRLPLPRPKKTVAMTCGPEIMMRLAARSAITLGVPEDQVYVSLERNMKCAIGHCGHCQYGPHFICKDGPVFPFHRVANLLEVHTL